MEECSMCGDRWLEELQGDVPRNYREAYQRACSAMEGRDPAIDADKTGVRYLAQGEGKGHFEIPVLDRVYAVSWPALTIRDTVSDEEPSYVLQLLMLHYLLSADGIALRGQWVSFRDLPEGRIYYPAFRGGSEARLKARFGENPQQLALAAEALGGIPTDLGDYAFIFWALPRLPLTIVLWEGDDEFSPEVRILFDSTAANYLPTEDLAVIARYVCGRLLRAV
jgi:hypothetical protein